MNPTEKPAISNVYHSRRWVARELKICDGTNVNEQYGIGCSLQRRETTHPEGYTSEELYRFAPGGTLLLSGFYEHDIPSLRAKAEASGLDFDHYESRQDWVAIKFGTR